MMHVAAYGRLGKEPKNIESAKTAMTVSSVAVDLVDRHGEQHTQWFGVVAFGRVADILTKHSKGDLIACSGRVQMNSWKNNEGAAQTELQIIADTIISARTARPGGKRKQPGASEQGDFDDDVPF